MSLYASVVAGEIGFGVFIALSLVLIVFVVRFANGIARRGRGRR